MREEGEITIRIYPNYDTDEPSFMFYVYEFDVQNITESIDTDYVDEGEVVASHNKEGLKKALREAYKVALEKIDQQEW